MSTAAAPPDDDQFESLLTFIRDNRGFDFTGYKRASLARRIQKRMTTAGAETYAAYQELLQRNPSEFTELFNTVLINVTGFLRDPDAWQYLAETALPALVATKGPDEPIRAWSAGCASGEEPYSLAVLLCEVLGEDRFRQSVKIYATDVDDEALVTARHARYPPKQLNAAFTPEQVGRYFEAENGLLSFRKDLRRSVIFGRHDLVQDPPISRVDLLVCRNTLMYFIADTQRRILANFHFALNPGGILFLGKSEALVTRTNLFEVEELRHHVFSKRTVATVRPPAPLLGAAPGVPADHTESLIKAAYEAGPLAQIVLDADQNVLAVNRHARALFGLTADAAGRPFKDLQVSYRPVDLRSLVDQVLADRRPMALSEVEFELGGNVEFLEIHALPVSGDPESGGVLLAFMQVGHYHSLREELERSQRELETAYEELQSTVEELETTNEELQSTNEELETTNEELHSTNEELETMNEELQSTNEELETINNELRDRSSDLDQLNAFLESILSSLAFGVAVLNAQMGVRVWNRRAEDLWGLRPEEVEGQHFLNLDIGLPVDQLRGAIRRCLSDQSTGERVTLDAINRRGRAILCDVTVLPQRSGDEVIGAIVLMSAREGGEEPPGAA